MGAKSLGKVGGGGTWEGVGWGVRGVVGELGTRRADAKSTT